MSRLQNRIVQNVTLCTMLLLASCASKNDPGSLRDDPLRPGSIDELRVKRLPAEQLYAAAREALDSSDYPTALQLYDRLDAQFPFTRFATQGKLEAIYAHYRAYEPELALSAADRFMRANPRHEHLDYVLYLRGRVNFDRGASDLMDALDLDTATRDPINARRAFEDFGRLLRRFPTSIYAPDARQRMIYLRERIGRHELAIARFYERRKAWVAASRRAQDIIAKFQGSAVVPPALEILAHSYAELGLDDRAAQIRSIRGASFPDAPSTEISSEADLTVDYESDEASDVTPPAPSRPAPPILAPDPRTPVAPSNEETTSEDEESSKARARGPQRRGR